MLGRAAVFGEWAEFRLAAQMRFSFPFFYIFFSLFLLDFQIQI
jgi:hypothetical protein